MPMKILILLSLLICSSLAVRIPFIRDAIFVPLSQSNSTTLTNHTCLQCLCKNLSSQLLLNCFPNDTCQLFSNFPRTYKIQQMSNATVYFPQAIFPNASQCCMPNLTLVLNKLRNATPIYARVPGPRCITIDNHGYLVTLSAGNISLVRFNATDMSLIDNTRGLFTGPSTIQYYNRNYYLGLGSRMLVIDSTSLAIQNNITSLNINGTRDMMFLKDGSTLVLASTVNNRLLFFNRSNNFSTNYDFAYMQPVSYLNPHGFFYVNDSFFYTTSWASNTIWSYSAVENTTQWTEHLYMNVTQTLNASSGNHIALDECGRWWFSLSNFGLQIFDEQGIFLGEMTLTNASIFDAIVTENYVLYLSDTRSNRLIRIDPEIEC